MQLTYWLMSTEVQSHFYTMDPAFTLWWPSSDSGLEWWLASVSVSSHHHNRPYLPASLCLKTYSRKLSTGLKALSRCFSPDDRARGHQIIIITPPVLPALNVSILNTTENHNLSLHFLLALLLKAWRQMSMYDDEDWNRLLVSNSGLFRIMENAIQV